MCQIACVATSHGKGRKGSAKEYSNNNNNNNNNTYSEGGRGRGWRCRNPLGAPRDSRRGTTQSTTSYQIKTYNLKYREKNLAQMYPPGVVEGQVPLEHATGLPSRTIEVVPKGGVRRDQLSGFFFHLILTSIKFLLVFYDDLFIDCWRRAGR
jgi:hypothetical protein